MNDNLPEDRLDAEWTDGYEIGYADAVAMIMSGEMLVPPWHGDPLEDPTCESCGQTFPASEYGILLKDRLWKRVAPRPDEAAFGSGVLCLDCIEKRLDRRVTLWDVETVNRYGERPTTRAAFLDVASTRAVERGDDREWPDDEAPPA